MATRRQRRGHRPPTWRRRLTRSLTLSLTLGLTLTLTLTLTRTVLRLGLVAREEVGVTGGQVLERRLVRSLVIPPRARGPLAITPVVTRP